MFSFPVCKILILCLLSDRKKIRKYSHDRHLSGLESNLSCLGYFAGTIFEIVEVRTPEQDAGKAFCLFRPLDRSQVRHPRDTEKKQLSVDERDRGSNLGEARSINSSSLGVSYMDYVTD
jgi:hypothetical protein